MTATNLNTSPKQKFIAILLAVALVVLQAPIGYATGHSAATGTNTENTQEQSTVDVGLSLSHAYLNYEGQTIAYPATKVTVPGWQDFSFSVAADAGYEIQKVSVNDSGNVQVLKPDTNGKYTLPGSMVDGVVSLSVDAVLTSEAMQAAADAAAVNISEASNAEASEQAEAAAAGQSDAAASEKQADAAAAGQSGAAASGQQSGTAATGDQATGAAATGDQASATSQQSDAAASSQQSGAAASGQSDAAASDQQSNATAATQQSGAASTQQAQTQATKTVYSYEDSNVKVTATLTDAAAVPDNANFVVTPVTKDSTGYNYNAYMQALNNNAADGDTYTSENTLLYDVAFMVQKTDAAGNAIEGQTEEFQPADGSVKVNFEFKNAQLSDELGAQEASAVEVKHLPLTDSVKAAADSTEAATNISANDVEVENVDATVTVQGTDKATFSVSDFSVFAFKTDEGQKNTWSGSNTFTIDNILMNFGDASNFAIYVNKLKSNTHIEGNIGAGEFDLVGGGEFINSEGSVITRNTVGSIEVTKTVSNKLGGTFNFAVFSKGSNGSLSKIDGSGFSIVVPVGQTSASFKLTNESYKNVFAALSGQDAEVYVYELDAAGNPLEEGATLDKTYTVSYGNNRVVGAGNADLYTNYIGAIKSSTTDNVTLMQTYFRGTVGEAMTYIDGMNNAGFNGNDYVFDTNSGLHVAVQNYKNIDSSLQYIKDGGGKITSTISNNLGSLSAYSATLATAKNGAIQENGALSVINLVSTTGTLSSDLDAANFQNVVNGQGIKELLTSNGYLLVNIDVTDMEASQYTLDSMQIDGVGYEGDNEEQARHIIYNLVTHSGEKDADGNYSSYSAYTGTISGNKCAGTIFAPSATVLQTDGIRGAVIADGFDRTTSGAEIHKSTIEHQINAQVSVSNKYVGDFDYRTSYTGTKTWKEDSEDIRPENLVVTLFADGVATTYKPTWVKDGGTWTYTFTGLPVYKADGSVIHYTAVESTPGGYDSESQTQDTEYELDQTSLLTVKAANEASEFAIDKQGIGMVVGQKATGGFVVWTSIPLTNTAKATVNQVAAGALSGFDANNCEYVCDNPQTMAVGDATVAINGDKDYGNTVHVSFNGTAFTNWAYGTVKADYKPGKADFTNTFHRDIIAVEKVWKDSEGKDTKPTVDSITVGLNRTVTKMVYPEGSHTVKATVLKGNNTYPVEAAIAADGSATVELTFGSEWDGNAKITSVEGLDGVDYTITNAGNGSKVATLAIAKVTKDLNFTINATSGWASLDDVVLKGDTTQGEEKTFTEKVKDVTLSKDNNWRVDFAIGANEEGKTYEVLSPADADGNPYKYSFSEVSVPGWSTTYTANNAEGITTGVVTISNVKQDKGTGSISFSGTKNIENRNFKAGDSITFKVKAVTDGAPMPEKSEVIITPESGTSASVDFGLINFKLSDLKDKTEAGKATGTFEYEVTETHSIAGMTTDSEKTVKVTATENDKGNIDVIADPSVEAGVFTFTNTYSGANTHFEVTKNFSDWGKAANFTFELAAGDNTAGEGVETPMPATKTATATESDKTAAFGDITFDHEGTYNYTITEKDDGVAGVTYDTTAHKVVVTVKKGADNKLNATVTYDGAESLTITNTYSDTSADLQVTKALSGRALTEADTFNFVLAAADSTDAAGSTIPAASVPMPESATATASSASNWVAKFGSINYTKAGTYKYAITEQQGAITGVTYDTTPKSVTVTVTKGDDNKLNAAVAYGEASSLTVTNTYGAKGSLNLGGTKTLEGKTLTDRAYNFVVTEKVEGVEKTVSTGTNDAAGKISFTAIDYGLKDVGEHTYTVKEVKDSDAGVTYDENAYTVKVKVADKGDGTLEATALEGSTALDGLNFTNKYDASTDLAFAGTKFMDGRAFQKGDEYTFTISAAEGTPMPAQNSVTIKPEAGTSAAIKFGEIDYKLSDLKDKTADGKATGTFDYTISEQAVKDGTGVTADATPVTATVVVTDKGDGTLDKTVTYKKGEESATGITFNNTYKAEDTSASIVATKAFAQGSTWPEGATFDFVLTPGSAVAADGTTAIPNPLKDSVTKTVTKDAKKVDFGSIKYMQAGTYNYTVKENIPAGAEEVNGVWMKDGIAYDGSTHSVLVTVTDNGDGTMSATVKYDDKAATDEGAVFTNSYNTTGAKVALQATKTLQGKKLEAGAFSFQLKDASGKALGEAVANDEQGKVTFPAISYTKADYDKAKTYEYTIEEVIPEGATQNEDGTYSLNGYTYDAAKYKATVTLSMDNAGKIDAEVAYSKISGEATQDSVTAPAFVNSYVSGDTTLTATKYLDGRAFQEGDSYSFKVEAQTEGAPAFENPEVTITPTSGTQASIDFGKATFTKAGAYTYVISENAVDAEGVTSDTDPVTVTIKATDNEDGTLSFEKTYTKANEAVNAASFTNKYRASEASATVGAKKAFAAESEWPEGAQFSFTLTPGAATDVNGKTIDNPLEGAVTKTATKDAPELNFDSITYKQAGTYTYTVKENIPAGAEEVNGVWMKDGIAYDGSTHNVLVKVTDDLKGKLSTSVVYDADATTGEGSAAAPTFTNSDNTTGTEIALAAQKTLNGKAPAAGQFSFKLTGEGQNQTVSNDASGKVTFGTISYTKADYDKQQTYVYTIEETIPAGATQNEDGSYTYEGMTYDATKYQATVTLSMGNDGQVQAAATYDNPSTEAVETSTAAPAFANSYTAAGQTTLTATKLMDGRAFQAGDSYTFTVEAQDGAPAFSQPGVTINPTSGTEAAVDFGTAQFTTAGTYTYVVSEVALDANGVKSDPAPVTVTVTATDNGNGGLDITKTYAKDGAEAAGVVFTNTYTTGGASATLSATKVLSGRAWAEGDAFTFNLTNAVGDVIATATATAENHTVSFPVQTYDQEGTYTYGITEVVPEGAELVNGVYMKDGVAYDGATHKAAVTVADNKAGQLVATVTYDDTQASAPAFTNSYVDATETTASLAATKHLTGKALTNGEFSFQLQDENGTVLQTVSNAADGTVAFAPITYKDAGTYNYRIVEVAGSANGVTYDSAQHTATVKVTKGIGNTLKAEVTYDNDSAKAPEFTNSYFGAEANLQFTKYFYGSNTQQAFSFTLTAANEDGSARGEGGSFSGTDEGQAFTIQASNGAFGEDYAATVDFGTIKYAQAGTYYYTVAEDAAGVEGVQMDDTVYLVKVTVADDQATTVEVKALGGSEGFTAMDEAQPAFYNNEIVTLDFMSFAMSGHTTNSKNATVSVAPEAKKVMTDENGESVVLTQGEFLFDLVDNATGQVVQTVGNAEDGTIAFSELTFTQAGTYTYQMREQAGESASITYDSTVFTVNVEVSADDKGALSATMTYQDGNGATIDQPRFHNSFEGIDIRVQKVSRSGGEGLVDCTYALWMVTPAGDVQIGEATSDESGYITFADVNMIKGVKYYFKEVKAPSGHTVDPYRTAYFTLNDSGTALEKAEATAEDGWHAAGYKDED